MTSTFQAGELAQKRCVPCEKGTPPLKGEPLRQLVNKLPDWTVVGEHHIQREFRLPDFKGALRLTNLIGELAEAEGHHPEIQLSWGKVLVTLWTHAASGLSENDFVLAAKIEQRMMQDRDLRSSLGPKPTTH
jgi:4a-hydroxytetrahydrobiopterin dehydratase